MVLVTGFGPFGSVVENPSARLAEALGEPFVILPVTYAAVDAWLESEPEFGALLSLGVAVGSEFPRQEVVAHNRLGPVPDAEGVAGPVVIDPRLPPQISSPVGPLMGIEFSAHAGDYLCNYLFFRAAARFPNRPVTFVHVAPFEKCAFETQLERLQAIRIQLATADKQGW
jgi:pyroglutamyl-peptidase